MLSHITFDGVEKEGSLPCERERDLGGKEDEKGGVAHWRKLSPQPGYQKSDGRRTALEQGFSRHSPKIAHIWNSTVVTNGCVHPVSLFPPLVGEGWGWE